MKKIKILKDSIIYVVCPTNIKTGGTELLHQLVYVLNQNNIKSEICYISNDYNVEICEAFKKYCDHYTIIDDIKDSKNNVVIFPERYTLLTRKIKNAQKGIWWLSVDNYLSRKDFIFCLKNYGLKSALKIIYRRLFTEDYQISMKEIKNLDFQLAQSFYAIDFLKKFNIDSMYLSDYINDDYTNIKFDKCHKENVILFNPKKGYNITKKLIDYDHNIKWIPLINMTNIEVKEALMKSKLYVDFGNFPGKDRIPREAVLANCCIITGKKGAANNSDDIKISPKYKFESPLRHKKEIFSQIYDIFNNYEKSFKEFENYKQYILSEKNQFYKDAIGIFEIL